MQGSASLLGATAEACTDGAAGCGTCTAGTFQITGAVTMCGLCPAGSTGTGAATCSDCAAGTYAAGVGSTTCSDCTAGSSTDSTKGASGGAGAVHLNCPPSPAIPCYP